MKKLWEKVGGGYIQETIHSSGFGEKDVHSLELRGNCGYLRYLRKEMYSERRYKRIPVRILNAEKEIILRFLSAYNKCDGLKAGGQKTEFKSFTTNSAILALALWYLVDNRLNLRITFHPESRGKRIYYHLNINSNDSTDKGKHLVKPLSEIKKLRRLDYTGWLFDLETESGTFSAGIGHTWIHNSPRRGPEFVTRKISLAVARIKLGKQKKLVLGNLEARRDWGFAGDYCKAMHLMLQQKKPSDFVVGTGESHSVKEFVKKAFAVVGIKDWQKYVQTSEEFLRPAEVERLVADPTKARKVLGWKPEVSFKELVKMMVEADLERENRGWKV